MVNVIEATARDGSTSATVSLHPGLQRQVLVDCTALLQQHELLVCPAGEGYASPGITITKARAVMGGKVAEFSLDIAANAEDKSFISVGVATNLGVFDLVIVVRLLGSSADAKPTQTYPLKGQ